MGELFFSQIGDRVRAEPRQLPKWPLPDATSSREGPCGLGYLLLLSGRICSRVRPWRFGLGRGCAAPKFWRGHAVAGLELGPFDPTYEFASHWCRRLYLLQRLAANVARRGLSKGRCRKANDRGKDR